MSHTALPWRVFRKTTVNGIERVMVGDGVEWVANVGTRDNAAFIVKACNAHEELVAACRNLLGKITLDGPIDGNPWCCKEVKAMAQVLANLEGHGDKFGLTLPDPRKTL